MVVINLVTLGDGPFFWPQNPSTFLQRDFFAGSKIYNGMAIFLRKNNTFWVSLVSPARKNRPKSSPLSCVCFVAKLLPRWKSRCKFHLFFVFFGVIFYNGNFGIYNGFFSCHAENSFLPCIKTRCKFMYFFDRFGTLQNLAETLKHRWLPSQMRIPRWKSRCKFHPFLVFFGVIFYNGNLLNLQRILMEFTTDLGSCPGKRSILSSSRFVEKSHFFDFSTIFVQIPL